MPFSVVKAPNLPAWESAFYTINTEWLKAYFSVTPADEQQLRNVGKIIEDGGAVLFILDHSTPIGTVALIREPNGDVEIAKMGVLEDFRGKGVGRLLLEAAIREARSLSTGTIYLETVEVLQPAIRLYASMGFVRVGEEHRHPLFGRTTFRMELR